MGFRTTNILNGDGLFNKKSEMFDGVDFLSDALNLAGLFES